MKHSPRGRTFTGAAAALLLLLVSAWAGASGASAQEQEEPRPAATPVPMQSPERGAEAKPARKKGRSVLRGRVLYADTKRPVRLANVTLVHLDRLFREPQQTEEGGGQLEEFETPFKSVTTGRRGEFEVGELAAGRYAVNVHAPGVVAAGNFLGAGIAAAASREFDERVVELDGTNAADKEILVVRGGSLSGRVTYDDGEPATNATVQIYCRRKGGEWSRCGVNGVKTDDRGLYRFEALPAGEYAVGASENNAGGDDQQQYGHQLTAFTGAYHPAAKTLERAAGVRVEAGDEAEGADIRFGDEALRRVAGVVRWRQDNSPTHRAIIRLQKIEPAGVGGAALPQSLPLSGAMSRSPYVAYAISNAMLPGDHLMGWSDEEGRWAFEDVPDGTYLLSATVFYSGRPGPYGAGESDPTATTQALPTTVQKMQEVTVRGGDVTDLRLLLSEGGRISGTVTVEGGARPGAFSSVYVTALVGGGRHVHGLPQVVLPNGGFLIAGLPPGEVSLELYLGQQTGGLYLKSMTAPDGTDLIRSPARVAEDGEVSGVRVVLGSDGATLAGRVRVASGGTPFGTTLVLAPADQSRWGARSRLCVANAAADGSFHIPCAPGDYLLITWRGWEEGHASPAEFISSRIARAQRVTLAPGERKSVEVVVEAEDEN